MNTLLSDWTKSTMGHAGGSDWLPGLCMWRGVTHWFTQEDSDMIKGWLESDHPEGCGPAQEGRDRYNRMYRTPVRLLSIIILLVHLDIPPEGCDYLFTL